MKAVFRIQFSVEDIEVKILQVFQIYVSMSLHRYPSVGLYTYLERCCLARLTKPVTKVEINVFILMQLTY